MAPWGVQLWMKRSMVQDGRVTTDPAAVHPSSVGQQFHIGVRPPELRPIEVRGALEVDRTNMESVEFSKGELDMGRLQAWLTAGLLLSASGYGADAAAEVLGAAQSSGLNAPTIAKTFQTCRIVTGARSRQRTDYWPYDAIHEGIIKGLGMEGDFEGLMDEIRSTIRIWRAPKHGHMELGKGYRPEPGFEGVDGGSIAFDFRGKTYVSVQKFIVSIPRDDRPLPWDCREAWKLPPAGGKRGMLIG